MIQKSLFKTNWLMSNPHLQTIWQTFFRPKLELTTQRERFFLPDGDFLDLDWAGYEGQPIILVLHGITGSINSPYARGMLRAVVDNNWHGVFMHFRGCSGESNHLPKFYHCGATEDFNTLASELQKRYPGKPIIAIGFSMGGNVLLKWLAETGANNPLRGAVVVSSLFELAKSSVHINQGIQRLYQWWLLRDLRALVLKKFAKTPMGSVKPEDIIKIRSMWDFDDKITAPLHGFNDVQDYYTKASARQYLKQIQTPTLYLVASDDPFITRDTIAEAHELSPYLTMELSDTGGHVGFVSGTPWNPKYWLEERIPQFVRELLFEKT